MSVTPLTSLANYIKSIGTAYVYTGDLLTTGGLAVLGATEGELGVDEQFQMNNLTAPEWTGEAIHESNIDGSSIEVTVPLIMGDSALYDKISPYGTAGGGYSKPTPVVETGVFIVSRKEVPDAGLSLAGGTWAPTAPLHYVIIPRAYIMPGRFAFKHQDGGKVIREVTIRAMFDDTRPEGGKLYTYGPTADLTGFAI